MRLVLLLLALACTSCAATNVYVDVFVSPLVPNDVQADMVRAADTVLDYVMTPTPETVYYLATPEVRQSAAPTVEPTAPARGQP